MFRSFSHFCFLMAYSLILQFSKELYCLTILYNYDRIKISYNIYKLQKIFLFFIIAITSCGRKLFRFTVSSEAMYHMDHVTRFLLIFRNNSRPYRFEYHFCADDIKKFTKFSPTKNLKWVVL